MTTDTALARTDGEDGSAAFSMIGATLVMLFILMLVVFVGRVTGSANDLQAAAQDAVRAATMAQTRSEAEAVAQRVFADALDERNVPCESGARLDFVSVPTNPSGDLVPGSTIEAKATCDVYSRDLWGLMPADKTVEVGAAEMVDRYRGERVGT